MAENRNMMMRFDGLSDAKARQSWYSVPQRALVLRPPETPKIITLNSPPPP